MAPQAAILFLSLGGSARRVASVKVLGTLGGPTVCYQGALAAMLGVGSVAVSLRLSCWG